MEMREQVTKLLQVKNESHEVDPQENNEELVEVSEATKRIANAYERFRNTLEPDEQDILRRRAIVRILKRRLGEGTPPTVVAEQLLQEMIRGNYIKAVTKSFAEVLGKRLAVIQYLLDTIPRNLRSWFFEVAAVTVDRDIFPRKQEEELVQLMYNDTWPRVAWADSLLSEDDRPTQTYMACHRSLFEADDMEITWHYWRRRWPVWDNVEVSVADLDVIAAGVVSFYDHMQHSLQHPARDRMNRLLRPVAVPYRVLRDTIQQDSLPEDQGELAGLVKQTVEQRADKIRKRMSKRAWNSIMFLFLTKTVLTGLLEVPYELYLVGALHLPALITNILFHPVLLFLTATTVRWPGSRNTEAVVEHLDAIVFGEGGLPTIVIRKNRQYGALVWTFFALIYVVLFMFFFWSMFSVLSLLEFSLVATFMFVVFLGLVTFLAARIRRSVNDLRLIPKREGAMGTLFTFLSLPVLEFGRWLAVHVRQLNVPLIFMDRVLEAPFKLLIDITEEWFSFVRERREEIV